MSSCCSLAQLYNSMNALSSMLQHVSLIQVSVIVFHCFVTSLTQEAREHSNKLFAPTRHTVQLNWPESSFPVGIVVPPQSVNITLNQRVLLNCTAVATFINWFVNGTSVSDLNMAVFNDSAKTRTLGSQLRTRPLSVLGTPESNESRITCVGTIHSPPSQDTSDPALILVQGEKHAWNWMRCKRNYVY